MSGVLNSTAQLDLLSYAPPQSTPAVDGYANFDGLRGEGITPCAISPRTPLSESAGGGGRAQSLEARTAAGVAAGSGLEAGLRPRALRDQGMAEPEGAPRLRPYQVEAIAAVERDWADGHRSTLLVLPTGTGKTVVFSELVRRELGAVHGGRALVLAHRTELLEQAANKLRDLGLQPHIDQADRIAPSYAQVVVGSVQTLRGARLERYAANAFSLVVPDEAHHAVATSYQNILGRFAGARVLGVTATPDRADGKALAKAFETVAFRYEMRRAIAEEFLVPLKARRVLVRDVDLTQVRSHHGDLDQAELAKIMLAEKALHGVVSPLVQLAGAMKTLVFAVDVAHAHALAELINAHKPGAALAIDGSAKKAERDAALSMFRRGRIQFLVNCAIYTEGFDEPSIECVALARPTQSRGLHTQMVGRVARLLGLTYAESVANGKPFGHVLDFVGNSKHRLACPADALAGSMLDDDRIAAALEALDGRDLEDVLVVAEDAVVAKQHAKLATAVAAYRTKEVDPFVGDRMPPLDPNSATGRRAATEKQLATLESMGYGKPPPGLTLAEASAMLDAESARVREGLGSIKQVKVLARLGCDVFKSSKKRCGQLMAVAVAGKFKRSAMVGQPEFRGKNLLP